jgi:molecular chaperone GrpE
MTAKKKAPDPRDSADAVDSEASDQSTRNPGRSRTEQEASAATTGPAPDSGPVPAGAASEREDQLASPQPDETLSLEDQLRAEKHACEDRWLRAVAELDNVRKRTRRQVEEAQRLATVDLMRSLLDVLDSFELALQSLSPSEQEPAELQKYRTGVELIQQRLLDILTARGLRKIEALGQTFDPSLHEAIQQLERAGVATGQITDVVQAGYQLNDLVLRPSRVIVAK